MHQGSAICRLIILLMMPRGLDLGLAANVSAGQPVTQLLILFFLIILIFVSPLTSLCWSSHAFMCLKVFLSAPSLHVHFPTLFCGLSQLFSFSCFTDLSFLSSALSRQGIKPHIYHMPNGKCELDKFADPLFYRQQQIGFPVLLNHCASASSVFLFIFSSNNPTKNSFCLEAWLGWPQCLKDIIFQL